MISEQKNKKTKKQNHNQPACSGKEAFWLHKLNHSNNVKNLQWKTAASVLVRKLSSQVQSIPHTCYKTHVKHCFIPFNGKHTSSTALFHSTENTRQALLYSIQRKTHVKHCFIPFNGKHTTSTALFHSTENTRQALLYSIQRKTHVKHCFIPFNGKHTSSTALFHSTENTRQALLYSIQRKTHVKHCFIPFNGKHTSSTALFHSTENTRQALLYSIQRKTWLPCMINCYNKQTKKYNL